MLSMQIWRKKKRKEKKNEDLVKKNRMLQNFRN